MYKVSVVIPTYNAGRYIERCARSLFEQTLEAVEYIFIDDCSTDDSMQVLESVLAAYPHRLPHTRIIKLTSNIGAANVRRKGIELATGDYIIQCDSDDWVERDMYKLMYQKAIAGNYDMVVCDIDYLGKDKSQALQHSNKSLIFIDFLIGNLDCALWNKLVKRQIFSNDIIYPTAHLAEDFALTPQLTHYCSNIGHVGKALYHYCLNSESVTKASSTKNILSKVYQQRQNINILFDFFNRECIVLPDYVIAVIKWRCRIWLSPIIGTNYGYRLWRSLYPELNHTFLHYKAIPLRKKVNFILCYLRISPIIRLYRHWKGMSKTANG